MRHPEDDTKPPFAFGDLDEALRRAADRAGVGMSVLAFGPQGGRVAYINDAGVEILGRPREEILRAKSLIEFVVPQDVERMAGETKRRIAGDARSTCVETTMVRGDGSQVPIVTYNGHIRLRDQHVTVSFFWDARQHRAETDRLTRVVSSSPDGIVLLRGLTILNVNAAGSALLAGTGPEVLAGGSLEELVVHDDLPLLRDQLDATLKGIGQTLQVYRVRHPDGKVVNAEVLSIPFDHEGEPAVLAFMRDVTERAQLQQQMARAERLASLSTLAAGLAHEINNPLSAALLQVDLLKRQLLAPPSAESAALMSRHADELRQTLARIGAVVSGVSAFARIGEERRVKIELGTVIASVERMLGPMLRHCGRYVNELPLLPRVEADRGRVEQVFMNLLLNAVQALPEGRPGNELRVSGRFTLDRRVCIEIKDNGSGVSAADLEHIFDPFFTTKPPGVGTGLGLTVCHNIVAAYGGEIQVESLPGNGCTMRVLLPPARGEPVMAQNQKPRVLIVDDEPHLATTLQLLLEDRHHVIATTHGEQAVAMLLEGAPVDVVLCDLVMPPPDGPEIYRRVTGARPELAQRFIFMTGGVYGKDVEAFLTTQSLSRVQKPFAPEYVEALIARTAVA